MLMAGFRHFPGRALGPPRFLSLAIEAALCRWHAPALVWIDRHRGPQGSGQRLEAGLGDVMVVAPIERLDVQRDAGVLGERLEELMDELGVEIAELAAREGHLPDEVGPPGDIDRTAGQ